MKFEIYGGKTCSGEVIVSGSKNNALKILSLSLLFRNPLVVKNIPLIEDVFRMKELIIVLIVSGRSIIDNIY